MEIKPGARLSSAVCDTEVLVIRGVGEHDLRCGGAAMTATGGARENVPNADHAEGTLLGKRYIDRETDLEVLCIRPGVGSLAVGDRGLVVKESVALPATD